MSMYPQEIGTIPEETVRIARAVCPKGTLVQVGASAFRVEQQGLTAKKKRR